MPMTLQGFNRSLETGIYEVSVNASPGNISDSFPPQQYHPVTAFIEQYSIPILCVLGLCGNSLASIVFLQKPLRNSSSSIFLATRGFSDNGFLCTLLVIWISRTFQLQLGTVPGACRVIVFLSYVCGCISVWLVVFVTMENYIRICRPFIVNRVCKTSTARVAVLFLCVVALGFYNFPFWAMTSDTCTPYQEHYNIVQALVYTDTVLTLVLPLICIIFLMTAILCDLVKSYNRRSKLHAPAVKRVQNPMAKVTKMLLAVTLTFFCLNLPSHVNRLRLMISSFLFEDPQYSSQLVEEAVQQTTLLLSYLSLAISIFVYILFGSKFRQVLKCILTCKTASEPYNTRKLETSLKSQDSKNCNPHADNGDVWERTALTSNTDEL